MAAVSDLSAFNTKLAVVVEDAGKGELESEFVNLGTQANCYNLSTQDNVWIDGEIIPEGQKIDGGWGEYPSVTKNPDTWNRWGTCPQVSPTTIGWGTCPKLNLPQVLILQR